MCWKKFRTEDSLSFQRAVKRQSISNLRSRMFESRAADEFRKLLRFPLETANVMRNIGGHIAETNMAAFGSTVAQTVNPVEERVIYQRQEVSLSMVP